MPVDEAHCPGCDALIGDAGMSLPTQCWKCGLIFGPNASNKPILRAKSSGSPFDPLIIILIALSPTLLYWLVGTFAWPVIRLVPWLKSLSGLAIVGLFLYGFGCLFYVLGKVANAEKGVRWVFAAIFFVALVHLDVVLLLRAIAVLSY